MLLPKCQVLCNNGLIMNNQMNDSAEKIMEAISALKEKAESDVPSEMKEGVDLLSIVKKLSRNRDRSRSR